MAYIEQTFVDGVTVVTAAWLNGLKDVLGAASLFQIYNPTQTYNVGDFVSYQAKLYKCTTQIAVPEAWNPAHWTTATIADYVSPQKIFWGEYGVSTFAEINAAINGGMLPLIKYNVTEYNARYAYYKKINKIKYTPQYIVTEYTFEDYQSDDVLTKLTISSATGWRTEETDFHDQLIGIEAQLEAITDQSDNLFNDIIAFNNSTGITRNGNEFVGTASAFQTFFIAPYNLDENESYTVSFDIYTEGNSSTSGVGLKLCTGTRSDPDEGGYEFDNDQLEPYHYKGWYAISFGPVVQDRAWGIYFEADSAPDNVWHISNIELTEGEEELEEYKPRYTAKDDVARRGVEENTDKIEDVEDYALGAYIENEASGAVVSFSDGAEGLPVKELTVDIEPVQDLHGYDNPWPGGGGKNKLAYPYYDTTKTVNGVTFTDLGDGTINVNGTASADADFIVANAGRFSLPSSAGIIINGGYSNNVFFRCAIDGNTPTSRGGDVSLTTTNGEITGNCYIRVASGTTANNIVIKPMIRLATETDATFAPYSNICPISGYTGVNVTRTGKNLLGGHDLGQAIVNAVGDTSISDFGSNQDGDYVIVSRGTDTSRKMFTNGIKFKENTQYTFIMRLSKYVTGSMLSSNFCFEYDDGTVSPITFDETSSSEVVTLRVTTIAGKTLSGISTGFYSGSAYLFYENSGIFEGIITTEEFEEYRGTTYNITFPSEAGTVYGGTLTINQDGTGELVVNRTSMDLGTRTWNLRNNSNIRQAWITHVTDMKYVSNSSPIPPNILCSDFKTVIPNTIWQPYIITQYTDNNYSNLVCCVSPNEYESASDFKAAMSGVQLVYELATPITYTLTAPQIKTLSGLNNIWTDTGDITNLVYYVGMDFLIAPITTSQIDALF